MYRPWLSLLAWLLVVAVVRVFWLVDVPPGVLTLDESAVDGLVKLALWLALPAVFLMMAGRQSPAGALRELGVRAHAPGGYAFGLIATMPMALVLPFASQVSSPDFEVLAGTVLLGPFAEEVLFRGFLLAFLVRRAGWPLWAALTATSLAFGLAHVSESDAVLLLSYGRVSALERIVSHVVLGSVGGLLFGWVYYRWGNLWYAIGLHACINLWWELTSGHAASAIPSTATMPISAAHATSLVLAVVLTLVWRQRTRTR